MLSEHLIIQNKKLLYRMIIIHLLRYFKINLSSDTNILLPLLSIILSYRGCNLGLELMLNPLLLSLHLSLSLVLSLLLQIPSLPWWTKWLLCLRDNQRIQQRFWITRKRLRILSLMFVLHCDIIKFVRTVPLLGMSGLSPCLLVSFIFFLPRVFSSSPESCLLSLLACVSSDRR